MMTQVRARIRWVLRPAFVLLLIVSAWIGWTWKTGNLGTVVPGRVHRSAQLSATQLERVIRGRDIKTVLNLRGENPAEAWYRAEKAAALRAGATLIDLPMASDQWLSHDQFRALVETLDHAKTPLLIHCEWGAERTGLVSAVVELLRPDGSQEAAYSQFSLGYLFLPIKDGLVMRGHLDRYAAWLAATGLTHRPEHFRRWLVEGYRPGSPSREYWPCNPYPLRVVTRPDVGRRPEWPANACETALAKEKAGAVR
jgi:protein tyrosine phosphatase (PTP) superfamily phosphohydrolase (DUF442 family)